MNGSPDPAAMTPADSPMTMHDVMASPELVDLMQPSVSAGDIAFDFNLRVLNQPDDRVRLSSFAGSRPVALIFGSYT